MEQLGDRGVWGGLQGKDTYLTLLYGYLHQKGYPDKVANRLLHGRCPENPLKQAAMLFSV